MGKKARSIGGGFKDERERRLGDVEIVNQEVQGISENKVRAAMKKMKSGKEVGPDDIPVEAWRCLGEMQVKFLIRLFNKILESESMPEEWRRSVLVPIYIRTKEMCRAAVTTGA